MRWQHSWPWVAVTAASLACGGAASSEELGDGTDPGAGGSEATQQLPGANQPASGMPFNPASGFMMPSAPPDPGYAPKGPPPQPCTNQYVFGLNVSIENSPVGCDTLKVIATDGGYTEQLSCFPAEGCLCTGAGERPGSYVISVSIVGPPEVLLARTDPVEVEQQQCHVVPENVLLEFPTSPIGGGVADLDAGSADAGSADAGASLP